MNLSLSKMLSVFNFLAANGAGRVDGSSSSDGGSWFVEVVSWLADAVVNVATVVWGWLITIFYVVIRFCLNIIDILQMFVERLVGIQAYNQEGGLSALKDYRDSDIIIRFITNDTILKTFGTLCVIGLILLIIFAIIAIIKQNYAAASGDGDEGKKGPNEILKKSGKAIFMCLLVPFLFVFGLLGSNAVLASVCNAIRGENDLTIGGLVFTASTYEANKFRKYASDGIKVPAVYTEATKVVRPADYSTQEDMQLLFYELSTGIVYIEAISEDDWFIRKQEVYNEHRWKDYLTSEDASISATEITGSTYFEAFRKDFYEFYDYYFPKGKIVTGNATLNELSMWDDIMKSIYKSNWLVNKSQKDTTFTFSSTYTTQDIMGVSSVDGKTIEASIIVNSDSYQGYENFATIELEYYVMADLIDYAIENNKTFYFVNADNDGIMWSGIDDPFSDEEEDKININEYSEAFVITGQDVGGKIDYNFEERPDDYTRADYIKSNDNFITDKLFYVSYYNGLNRLYFSKTGATSENDGATYIICTKDASTGRYIPVTQTTTTFRSNYLADDYGGPVVARGIFESESIIPKSYVKPTIIEEQKVDEYGNELSLATSSLSPYAIDDTYEGNSNLYDTTTNFTGTLDNLLGLDIFTPLVDAANEAVELFKTSVQNNFASQIGIWWQDGNALKLYTDTDAITEGNKLLINKNITGFKYTAYQGNKPTKIELFDKNGRNITSGASYTTDTGSDTSFSCEVLRPTAYIVIQEDVLSGITIPWFVADAGSLSQVISLVSQATSESLFTSHNIIVAKYEYDQIKITGLKDGAVNKEFYLLANMNITGIGQLDDSTKTISYKSSGEYITNTQVGLNGVLPIYVEKKTNLVLIDGEIYEADGDLFYGRETASEFFNDIATTYFNQTYLSSMASYATRVISGADVQFQTDEWIKIFGTLNGSGDELKLNFNTALMALQYKAGLAASLTEYTHKYYSISNEQIIEGEGGAKSYSGTINYYDEHNRELTSVEYDDRTERYGKATITVQAIMNRAGNQVNSMFVRGESGTTISPIELENKYKSLFDLIKDAVTNAEDFDTERKAYSYNVTYEYNFTEFTKGGSTVALLGANIMGVTITPSEGNTETTTHLWLKNGNVVSMGGTELSMSAAKGYISAGNKGEGVKVKYDDFTPVENDKKAKSPATNLVTNGKLTANIWNIRNVSDYDQFYIYFLRGDFSWSLLFDFCLNLPKLTLVPLSLNFVFRCKMGTTYDYTENVIYRLQAGQFYLDYNFRESSGIGITNLFRMSSINPFILIFSTVLVLKIIWTCVWGLILRIYNMLLLFIMLPPVCSTMPMDDGKRFSKWKDELIEQMFSAYGVLIMLNLYFVIVPIVKDVTSDLITPGDLPTTITGMFSTISLGVKDFIGKISGLGASIKSMGANFLGSIGLGGTNLFTLATELTDAELNLLGYVNRIIYIIFFLVLTTMLTNGKELISTVLGLGKLSDPNVDGMIKSVKGDIAKAVNVAKKPVDKIKNLAGKAANEYVKHKFNVDAGAMVGAKPKGAALSGGTSSGPTADGTIGGSTPPPTTLPGGGGGASPAGAIPATSSEEKPATPPKQDVNVNIDSKLEVPEGKTEIVEENGTAAVVGAEPIAGYLGSGDGGNIGSGKAAYVSPELEEMNFGHVPTDARYDAIDKEYVDKTLLDVQADIDNIKEFMEEERVNLPGQDLVNMTVSEYEKKVAELEDRRVKAYEKKSALEEQEVTLQNQGKFSGENKQKWDRENNEVQNELKAIETEKSKLGPDSGVYNKIMQDYEDRMRDYEAYANDLEHYKDIRETNEKADSNREAFRKEIEDQFKESKVVPVDTSNVMEAVETEKAVEPIKKDAEKSLNTVEDVASAVEQIKEQTTKNTENIKQLEETKTSADDAARIAVAAATEASMAAIQNAEIDAKTANEAATAESAHNADLAAKSIQSTQSDYAVDARVAQELDANEKQKIIDEAAAKAGGSNSNSSSEQQEPVNMDNQYSGTASSPSSDAKPKKKSKLKTALKVAALTTLAPWAVPVAVTGVMVAKKVINKKQGLTKTGKAAAQANVQNAAVNANEHNTVSQQSQTTREVTNTSQNESVQESKESIDMEAAFREGDKARAEAQKEKTKKTVENAKKNAKQVLKTAGVAALGAVTLAAPPAVALSAVGGVMTVAGAKAVKKGLTKAGIIRAKHTNPIDQVNNSASGRAAEARRENAANVQASQAEIDKKIKDEVKKQVDSQVNSKVKTEVQKQVGPEVEKQVNSKINNEMKADTKKQTKTETSKTKQERERDLRTEIVRGATKGAEKERNTIVNEHAYKERQRTQKTATASQTKTTSSTQGARTTIGKENVGSVTTRANNSQAPTRPTKSSSPTKEPKTTINYDFKKAEAQQNEEIFKKINLQASSKNAEVKETARKARKDIAKIHMQVNQGNMSEQDGLKAIEDIMKKLK